MNNDFSSNTRNNMIIDDVLRSVDSQDQYHPDMETLSV